jgi:hypothetical protein
MKTLVERKIDRLNRTLENQLDGDRTGTRVSSPDVGEAALTAVLTAQAALRELPAHMQEAVQERIEAALREQAEGEDMRLQLLKETDEVPGPFASLDEWDAAGRPGGEEAAARASNRGLAIDESGWGAKDASNASGDASGGAATIPEANEAPVTGWTAPPADTGEGGNAAGVAIETQSPPADETPAARRARERAEADANKSQGQGDS